MKCTIDRVCCKTNTVCSYFRYFVDKRTGCISKKDNMDKKTYPAIVTILFSIYNITAGTFTPKRNKLNTINTNMTIIFESYTFSIPKSVNVYTIVLHFFCQF